MAPDDSVNLVLRATLDLWMSHHIDNERIDSLVSRFDSCGI